MPLILIVSSIGSPWFALAGFLNNILSPLADRPDSFLKNYSHFIELLKAVSTSTYPFMKPSWSSEEGLITTTHWQNCLSWKLKPSWNFWMVVWGQLTFKGTTDSNRRRMEWQWVIQFVPLLATSTSNGVSLQRQTNCRFYSECGWHICDLAKWCKGDTELSNPNQ
jgi:hypothetical protein